MSYKTIILRTNGVDYSAVPLPEYGYVSTISMNLHPSPVYPRGYTIWDDGSEFDSRRLTVTALLDATDAGTVLGLLNDDDKGRGLDVTMILPHGSGFYPGGPDKGDRGQFQTRLISMRPLPVEEEPWQYFRVVMDFIVTSFPTGYIFPAEENEGDLQIGTVENLRYPPDFPGSRSEYARSTTVTEGGIPYTIDAPQDSDAFYTTLPLVCLQPKAASLINHVVNTVRGNDVDIVAQDNNYIFGREQSGSGTYTCKMLSTDIPVKHNRFNQFEFSLTFYMISRA